MVWKVKSFGLNSKQLVFIFIDILTILYNLFASFLYGQQNGKSWPIILFISFLYIIGRLIFLYKDRHKSFSWFELSILLLAFVLNIRYTGIILLLAIPILGGDFAP